MTEKLNPGGLPTTRKKSRRRAKLSACAKWRLVPGKPTWPVPRAFRRPYLGRWQRQGLEQAAPSSAEREEIKRPRAELKRVEMARDMLKKVVTIFAQPPQS